MIVDKSNEEMKRSISYYDYVICISTVIFVGFTIMTIVTAAGKSIMPAWTWWFFAIIAFPFLIHIIACSIKNYKLKKLFEGSETKTESSMEV